MTKGLTKTQIQAMSGDKYSKMEKAKFLLEQEGYELDKILFDFKKGKDEIDSLLKTGFNFRNAKSSGAPKILENILKRLKSEEFLFNYDALLKTIGYFNSWAQMTFLLLDHEFERVLGDGISNSDIIHELTKKIMIKLDLNNKKKVEFEKKNIIKVSKEFKELDFSIMPSDKFTQVILSLILFILLCLDWGSCLWKIKNQRVHSSRKPEKKENSWCEERWSGWERRPRAENQGFGIW